jgi:glycosyl hydrolase family 123/cellulose/xylan binding protein with CBM9 domain
MRVTIFCFVSVLGVLVSQAHAASDWTLLVYENFESYAEKATLEPPWRVQVSKGSTCRVTREAASPFERGVRSLRMENPTPAKHLANMQIVFGRVDTGRVKLQFDFRVGQAQNNWGAMLYRLDKKTGWGVAATLKCGLTDGPFAGQIVNTAISYRRTPLQPAVAKKWYQATIVTGAPFGTCDMTVQRSDGRPVTVRHLTGRSGRGKPGWIDRLLIGAGWHGAKGAFFVDNVRIWAEHPHPKAKAPLRVARTPKAPEATARWVTEPPKIDGKLDEPCWRNNVTLDAAKGWRTDKRAPEQTLIGLCYDTRHLYVAARCSERHMDQIVATLKPSQTDINTWSEDELEFFIQPDLSRPLYGQFMIGAAGARGDLTPKHGMAWNTGWTAAAARHKTGWTVECAIPLARVLPDDGYVGTPALGQAWGINFNRHHVKPEWLSGWSRTVIGFHDPVNYGRVVFGEPTGNRPRLLGCQPGPLFYGRDVAVELTWRNPGDKPVRLAGRLVQTRAGKPVGTARTQDVVLAPSQEGTLRLPYTFQTPGEHGLRVTVEHDGRLVYEAQAKADLPELKPTLANWTRRADWARRVAVRLPDAKARADQQKAAQAMAGRVRGLVKRLEQTGSYGPAECRELTEAILELDKDRVLARQVDFLRVYEADLASSGDLARAGYVVGTGTPLDWVFPRSVPPRIPGKAALTAARGEHESFQVVVYSPWRDLSDIKVELPELRHTDGSSVLGPDRIDHEVAGYLAVPQAVRDPDDPVFWPDPLLSTEYAHAPHKRIDVVKGQNQAFWITVHVPADARPGVYTGQATVTVKDRPSVSVPVRLAVWDFELPRRPSLATDCWLSMDHPYKSKRPYRIAADTITDAQLRLLSRFVTNYRVSSTPYGNVMCTLPKLIRGRDGQLRVDWSRFDRIMDVAFADGSTNFNPNFSCNSGFFSYFGQYSSVGVPTVIHNEATGKDEVVWDGKRPKPDKKYPTRHHWGRVLQKRAFERNFQDDSLYIQFMKLYVKHLKEKGWLRHARLENWDEPGGRTLRILRRHHPFLKKHCPELKLTAFRAVPSIGLDERHIDVWAPLLEQVPSEREAIGRHVREHGHEFWMYVCGGQRRSAFGRTPAVLVSGSPIERRVMPWMCWKWEITGYLMYALNAWHGRMEYTWSPQPRLTIRVPRGRRADVGNMFFPYPLPADCPKLQTFAGSIRLVNARDGIEDYEYFRICRELTEQLKQKCALSDADRKLLDRSERLLAVPGKLIRSPYDWEDDGTPYFKCRAELGRHIVTLKQRLR